MPSVEVGGAIDFRVTDGDPLVTAELLSVFNEFVDAEFEADLRARRAEHGDPAESHEPARTGKQRHHDATVAIFRAAHAAAHEGKVATPLVNIVVDAATFACVMYDAGLTSDPDPYNDDDMEPDLETLRCHTTNGVVLHPHHVLRAALAGHVRRVVIDSAGVVVDRDESSSSLPDRHATRQCC